LRRFSFCRDVDFLVTICDKSLPQGRRGSRVFHPDADGELSVVRENYQRKKVEGETPGAQEGSSSGRFETAIAATE